MKVSGIESNGNTIEPVLVHLAVPKPGSSAWVPLSDVNTKVIIEGSDDRPSHPSGDYGTPEMAEAISFLGESFVQDLIPRTSIPPIRSQAASLPWGGLYDADWDGGVDGRIVPWAPPHCGHRDGRTIDLSVRYLTSPQKNALRNAAIDSGFGFFYPPESPANLAANHWHATFK